VSQEAESVKNQAKASKDRPSSRTFPGKGGGRGKAGVWEDQRKGIECEGGLGGGQEISGLFLFAGKQLIRKS